MRIVVKVGSNILTRSDGKPNVTNMSALVDQIAQLHGKGHQVVLVSSGAVACGRGSITPDHPLDSVAARQLFSSIGQIRLINYYSQLFSEYGIVVGQVLTQKENFSSPTSYENQQQCMLNLLGNNVIPIVNENDTASLTELMFTDNDELAGLIATMLSADMLIILTAVEKVAINFGKPDQKDLEDVTVAEAKQYLEEGQFGKGSMEPKVRAAVKFAESRPGRVCIIGSLEKAAEAMAGLSGTRIHE